MISGGQAQMTSGSRASGAGRSGRGSASWRKSRNVGSRPPAGSSSEHSSKKTRWPTKATRATRLEYARVRVCLLRPGPGPAPHAAALERAGAEVVVAERAVSGRFDAVVAWGWRVAGEAFCVDAAVRASLVTRLEHRALAQGAPSRLAAVVA